MKTKQKMQKDAGDDGKMTAGVVEKGAAALGRAGERGRGEKGAGRGKDINH